MFATLLRRTAQTTESAATSTGAGNYQLKKVWPPDFTKLSPQAQLRFEKKYKRRLALKYERPRWNKAVKLAQFITISGFVGALFFSELEFFGKQYSPSDEFKKRIKSVFGSIDPEKRHERRSDAPGVPPLNPEQSK